MKKIKSITIAAALTSAVCVGSFPTTVNAQDDIGVVVPKAFAAMRAHKWEEAQALLAQVTNQYSERGAGLFGGKFGALYYNRGFCELKIAGKFNNAGGQANIDQANKFYEKAKESFEKCRTIPSDDKSANAYHNKCLLYWGQAEQGLGAYDEAIKQYKKFVEVRDPQKDKYNIGMYNINMSICHFRLEKPNLPEGINYLETAMANKEKLFIPDAAIVQSFQSLSQAVIQTKKKKILIDFVNKNRSSITLEPYQMYQFTPFFMKLGTEAFNEGMVDVAFTLFGLMPGSMATEQDIALHQTNILGNKRPEVKDFFFRGVTPIDPKKLERDYGRVTNAMNIGDPHEIHALRSLAYTHEETGYIRGAYGAYKQLELYFNKSKDREHHLYNLVRTSSLIGEVFETEKYGRIFLGKYPDSEYKDAVRNMMLISLFYSGEYDKAYEVSKEMIEKGDVADNTDPHDICLHVYGGSMFYKGMFFDAHEHLVKHVKMYPESDFKVASRYFEAANLSRLRNWNKAGPKLDKFLADYPSDNENIYIPFALYDRASTHFNTEENEEAIAKLDLIEKNYPGAGVEDMAYVLRGDVHRASEQKAESKAYYVKALELAEKRDNRLVAGESLFKLVALLGDEKDEEADLTLAIEWYDKFWKDYQNSPYKTQVAATGVPALMAAQPSRADEALENLQGVISDLAKKKDAPDIERAINTYGKYYLQNNHTAEELKEHFANFPGVNAGDKKAQALLQIAVIGVYEELLDAAEKDKNNGNIIKYTAMIKVMFNDLNSSFEPKEMSNFILMRLANFVGKSKTKEMRDRGLVFYDEILSRKDVAFQTKARFGKAQILARSDSRANQDTAKKTLLEILANNTEEGDNGEKKIINRKTAEQAYYALIELYQTQQDWAALEEACRAYSKDGYKRKKPEAAFLLAVSYDKQDKHADAIGAYNGVSGRYRTKWEIAVPSQLRSSELTWKHGKAVKDKSAKQIAYESAALFLKSRNAAFEENKVKMSRELVADYTKLQQLVTEWGSSSEVTEISTGDK